MALRSIADSHENFYGLIRIKIRLQFICRNRRNKYNLLRMDNTGYE